MRVALDVTMMSEVGSRKYKVYITCRQNNEEILPCSQGLSPPIVKAGFDPCGSFRTFSL